MHEFEHGELKSGRGGKVKSRRQAITIGLREAGASRSRESPKSGSHQEVEGKSHVRAKGRRESSLAMDGSGARQLTGKGAGAGRSRVRKDDLAYDELYDRAKKEGIEGRSKMSKQQLESALYR
jgi:hypothetical protein